MHCGYLDTTQKDNYSSFLTPTLVGGRRHLSSEIFTENDPPRVWNWLYGISSISYALWCGYSCLATIVSHPAQNHWQCWQLHNELFGCRQSHNLSAIAELLVRFTVLHLSAILYTRVCTLRSRGMIIVEAIKNVEFCQHLQIDITLLSSHNNWFCS